MKKSFISMMLFFVYGCTSSNQYAVLHVSFDNIKAPHCWVKMANEIGPSSGTISIKPGKMVERSFKLTHPCFVNLSCYDSDNSTKFFSYILYLSPGDDLELKADFNKPDYNVVVTGRGSSNNMPLM